VGMDDAELTALVPAVQALAFLTDPDGPDGPDTGFSESASIEVRLSRATVTVAVDTSGTVDVAAEIKRAEKDLAAARKELETTTAKLGNEAFVAKAPEAVVQKITARQQLARDEVERLTKRLGDLGSA